jgi:hypothetical protein
MIVTEFDAGAVHLTIFADGVKTRMLESDDGDVCNWANKSPSFDISGALTVKSIT